MRRTTLILVTGLTVALALATGLSACGSSGSSTEGGGGNAGKIEAAEGEAVSQESLEKELEVHLLAYEGSGGGLWFETAGGECSINSVYVGEEVSSYEEDPNTLVSPDGNAAVTTLPVTEIGNEYKQLTDADCLSAIARALRWEE